MMCDAGACSSIYAVEDGGCRARPDFHPIFSTVSSFLVPLSCFLLLSGSFTVLADEISHPGSPDRLFIHQPSAANSLSSGQGRKQPQPLPRYPGIALRRVRYVLLVSVRGRRPPNTRFVPKMCWTHLKCVSSLFPSGPTGRRRPRQPSPGSALLPGK